MNKNTIPFVIERRGDSERSYDIYSRLLEDRIIFIGEEIDGTLANLVIAQLLLLDQKDSNSDIYLYINSPGGSISAGLAIYDTIQFIHSPIRTVCIGIAASMAAVLLSAGTPGKRHALPNSRVMIHQPRTHITQAQVATVTEQGIDFKLSQDMRKQLTEILSKHTGQAYRKVWKDSETDKWMVPTQALEYGLIDEIITKKPV